ncbi:Protein phosphatase 2C 14 [Actinidia chinensis var. chinensis]|uniref:protein-serine/threonine phosphatase n=1 Tax=Actinidia chinensis var. chinensis TaxID=1590841 RepID=A0A2R6REV1_ACTCC|nr:Protein phosphatase 2C 14 [Actinidia chinensis var. chinensis]
MYRTQKMPPPSISPLSDVNEIVSTRSSSDFPGKQTGDRVGPISVSGSLKRKRPPTIEIPNVLREIRADTKLGFGEFASRNDAVCFSGSGVGVFSVKGKKKFMEDTHKIVSRSHGIKGFFGVYDGHGGGKAAEFVAENLHDNIFKMLENCTEISEAVKAGYLKTDQEFLKQGLGSGACCVTALIGGNEIVISNLGDCRAVLCRTGVAEALTNDHRAGQEDERKRIESKGGYVEMHRGAWRVHGVLSVSRSIGDAHLKDWVLAEPDTKTLYMTQDMEYLILASDGLWEEVGNQEAVDIVLRSCLLDKKLGPILGENNNGIGFLSTSTSSMLQRVSLVKQKNKTGPRSSRKNKVSIKDSENDFACENESPPSKTQKFSFGTSTNVQSPNQEHVIFKKRPASSGLEAACNQLVNLAVTRGSLDDITVMIIDLNHFK